MKTICPVIKTQQRIHTFLVPLLQSVSYCLRIQEKKEEGGRERNMQNRRRNDKQNVEELDKYKLKKPSMKIIKRASFKS
jgi:hypothetical protein